MNKHLLMAEATKRGVRTIKELSEASGIKRNTLSAKLNGHRAFDTNEIDRLCDVSGISDGAIKAEIFLRESSQ